MHKPLLFSLLGVFFVMVITFGIDITGFATTEPEIARMVLLFDIVVGAIIMIVVSSLEVWYILRE
tara:strand:- start:1732 stop:1926 length:195 start_codon:yes stop_codon:yes gene_type:complete